MSVRLGTRFGAPAIASIALGGLHAWVVSAVVGGMLVAAVIILHAQPKLHRWRRLLRRR